MKSKLKVPEYQVAGHRALNGNLGPQVDGSGRFYKPLQKKERGTREVAFYESFMSDESVPDNIRKFFPKFYGTELIEASDGSGPQLHLVLEDIISNYTNPCIMDVKIGSRTWYPQASEEYIQKCIRKDRGSSSVALGFRISGLQVYEGAELGYWKPYYKLTQKYTTDEVRSALRKFTSSNKPTKVEKGHVPVLAPSGGLFGILEQLLELKAWFENQTVYQFYSSSILMVYAEELPEKDKCPGPTIKLIDFAHVVEGNGIIDHNFLGGLCSLIKFISEIINTPNGCIPEDSMK